MTHMINKIPKLCEEGKPGPVWISECGTFGDSRCRLSQPKACRPPTLPLKLCAGSLSGAFCTSTAAAHAVLCMLHAARQRSCHGSTA